ncbi:MAG: fibronectin type III domain-containing protein, partial [Bacteroidales bacterium]|nr:fibronectin type III domain-containing protein [Bacteroidales bacterium]
MKKIHHLTLSLIICITFAAQNVFAAANLQIVQLYSGAPAYKTNKRQAVDICPKVVIANIGNTASIGNDTVLFEAVGRTWNYKMPVPSIAAGDTVMLETPAGSGYTPSAIASHTIKATLDGQEKTGDFTVTEHSISQYAGPYSTWRIAEGTEAGRYGSIYRLKNSERFSSVVIEFTLGAFGKFPELDFSMSVFSVNETTMELTEIYTSPLMHRPHEGSYTGTYPFNTPLLPSGLYLITVNQLGSEPLFICGDEYYESAIYSVSGNSAIKEFNGSLEIILNTSQVQNFYPENGEKKVALNSVAEITFFENHTLSNAARITITPNPGGVSANIRGNKLSLTHNDFNHYTTYRIKVNTGTYSGQWDTLGWAFTTQMDPSSCNAPTDLNATQTDTSSITLEWVENNPTITLWDIKYGLKDFDTSSAGTLIQNVSQTSYTVNGLTPGARYDIYVRSHCAASGTSGWSKKYSFATKRIPVRLNAIFNATTKIDNIDWGGRFISFMSGSPYKTQSIGYNLYNVGLRHGEFIDGILYVFTLDSIILYDENYNKTGGIKTGKPFNDAAYDYSTGTMYGVTGTAATGGVGTLCTIDLQTGTVIELGNITPSMSALCCTKDGMLYGISNSEGTKGNLYSINKTTRVTAPEIQTERAINGLQSLMIDHNSERMFWLNNSITSCNLVELDVQTDEVIDLGFIGDGRADQSFQYYHSLYSVYDRTKGTMPEKLATKVNITTPIWIAFKNNIGSVDLNNITINPSVSGLNITLRNDTVFIAHDPLNYNTTYTVSVSNVAELGGIYRWRFTTMLDPSGCHEVEELKVVNISYSSATLKWKDVGHPEGWQIAAGVSGFDPSTSGRIYDVLSDSVTIEGLMDGMEYDFYVRTVCDSTPDYESYGPWSNVVSGATIPDCRYPITDFPYKEDFEDMSGSVRCYENASNTNWLRYGNDGADERPYSGEYYYKAVGVDEEAVLITPKFDLSFLLNEPVLDFWYKIPQGDGQDYLGIHYRTGEDSAWNIIWTNTTASENVEEWTRQIISLPNISSDYRIAFQAILNGGEGVWLDDISIHEFYSSDIA